MSHDPNDCYDFDGTDEATQPLPCPFCGCAEAFVQNAGWRANTFMRCPDCRTTFSVDNGTARTHADTVAAWNRRALTPSPTLEPSFRQGDIDMAKHFARQEYFSPNADQAGKLDRALSKLVEYLRPSPTLEPTDAEVERAAEIIWNDLYGARAGAWDNPPADSVAGIQMRATARAALIAARTS
jgi:hypothetical protein